MWIYYYIMYGPGHQGTDDGFVKFADGEDPEIVEDRISAIIAGYDNVIAYYWKVEAPSGSYLKDKVESMEYELVTLQKAIEELKNETVFFPQAMPCPDNLMQDRFKGKIEKDLLENLHKEGIVIDIEELGELKRGGITYLGEDKVKLIEAIEKTKSYGD